MSFNLKTTLKRLMAPLDLDAQRRKNYINVRPHVLAAVAAAWALGVPTSLIRGGLLRLKCRYDFQIGENLPIHLGDLEIEL